MLESDKATMEVPSPRRGSSQESVSVGDTVSEGAPLLTLERPTRRRRRGPSRTARPRSRARGDERAGDRRAARRGRGAGAEADRPPAARGRRGAAPAAATTAQRDGVRRAARTAGLRGPGARRLARELGVDLPA